MIADPVSHCSFRLVQEVLANPLGPLYHRIHLVVGTYLYLLLLLKFSQKEGIPSDVWVTCKRGYKIRWNCTNITFNLRWQSRVKPRSCGTAAKEPPGPVCGATKVYPGTPANSRKSSCGALFSCSRKSVKRIVDFSVASVGFRAVV